MNWHILCEHNDRFWHIHNKIKRVVIRVIYRFPGLSRKGYKNPQELQGMKYMLLLSVADIRTSLLFMRKMLYPVLEQFIRSFEPSNVQFI